MRIELLKAVVPSANQQDADLKASEGLLERNASIHRDEDVEVGLRTAEQYPIPEPRPAHIADCRSGVPLC